MRALPGQGRPISQILRAHPALRRAVGRITVAGCLAFLLTSSPVRAADEPPITDVAKFPPWFKEFTSAVITNSQRAKDQAEAKLAEARGTGDRVTETYAELAVATAFRRQNNLPTALEHTRAALLLVETLPDDLLRFNANYIHGLNLSASGDYASAVEYLLRSLSYADARHSTRARATAVAALGSVYDRLGELPKALEFKREALALSEQLGDQHAIGMYAGNLASLQDTLGDRAAARRNYERALAIVRASGNRTETADIEQQLAMLDFAEGKAESALAALDPILKNRRTLRGKNKLTLTLMARAEILQHLGRLDEALAHAGEARTYADAIDSRNLRASVYRRLASVQEARGDLAAALAATRREFTEREAMAGEAAKKRAAELQIQFDVAKKDRELARLAAENTLRAADTRAQTAQVALKAAELRAKDAELHAKDAELDRARTSRLALGATALSVLSLLGATVLVLRARIRAERKILADTRVARDTAEQADALKSRLLGFASHDLKAPLASMSAATHLLEDAAAQPDQVRSLAGAMRTEATRMIHLVHDFIDRSALDAGRLELRPSPLDLSHIVSRVVADFRPRATQKLQSLSFEGPVTPLPLVSGEAARLEQIFANLLSNAVHYTPRQGSIWVVLGHNASGVWCEVRDSGPGILPEEQARLFQPFARLSARPTGGESSSGLGLFLALELVHLHGGTLTVDSPPGAGATFRLTLPALPSAAPAF